MSCLVIQEFQICVHSNDHTPPHVDVYKDRGKVKIYLSLGRGMPSIGPSVGLSERDVTRAFQICLERHGEMVALWRSIHGDKEVR